ncbi:MAG: ABC transporter permease [Candidatus Heimdallarchaeaceae archaeon]
MLRFSVRFFFHNRKRTFQAIMTLTLGLVIYIATTLLVRGYSSNISGMAEIIEPSDLLLISEDGKSLSESRIDIEVLNFLQEYSIQTPIVEVILPQIYMPITIKGETGLEINTHLRLLNISLFEQFQQHHYSFPLSEMYSGELILGQQTAYLISAGVGSIIQVQIEDLFVNDTFYLSSTDNYSIVNIIESGHEYDLELLGSIDTINLPESISYFSFIELRIGDKREIDTIIADIENQFENLNVMNEKQTQNFIQYATEDVIKTLTLLEIMFFILMLVSISYSIYTLVKESEEEIFTLRSIGATKNQIILLFMLQSLFIGVVAGLLSLIVGYLGVSGIVGIVTAVMSLPFIPLSINLGLIGTIFLFSLTLSIISGIYPAVKASQIRVIKEDL